MDQDETFAAMVFKQEQLEQEINKLVSKNNQLEQENDQMKTTLNVVKENLELKTWIHSFSNGTYQELPAFRGKPSNLCQNTLDETQFRKDLQQSGIKHDLRTSSPVDFKSFIQCSVHTDTNGNRSFQADIPPEVKVSGRLLGEIAYQLNQRILLHVFPRQKRFYGFTLLNIPDKIIEVSAHPLTGKVDQGYRLYLTQRYADLMENLSQLGFKAALHPPFSEFVVNNYGILKDKPAKFSAQAMDFNNPDFLRNLIMTAAPKNLQGNLLLLLTCLCKMAERDGKPLLLL